MMKKQISTDYENLHMPIFRKYPELFPVSPSISDYMWALCVIWSRAFGVTREGEYLHVLAPIMDMFNHCCHIKFAIDDFVKFDEEDNVSIVFCSSMYHEVDHCFLCGHDCIETMYGIPKRILEWRGYLD